MSKRRYDFLNRPKNNEQNELTKHLAEDHYNFETDINVSILKKDVTSQPQRELMEDRIICRLGTMQLTI